MKIISVANFSSGNSFFLSARMRQTFLKLLTFNFLLLTFLLLTNTGWGQYTVNFEGASETKTGYSSGNVTLSGIQWNLTEALIGTDAADYKNGSRSARIRGYSSSSMTMNANKSNGLGSITFKYWRYGTDGQATWKVEYSTNDGTSWTQAGSNFTPPANNNEQTFSATAINITGNVRIRIVHVSGGNTSVNRRFNIDDISITDYTTSASGSSATDYFRSNSANVGTGGSWGTATNWQSSSDSITWITSTLVPTAAANSITIRSGHNINADVNSGGDQIYIKSGAQLTISANTFTLADATSTNGYGGFDLVVEGGTLNRTGGTFTVSSGATISFTGTSIYTHAINGGTIPTASWATSSLCNITGATNSIPSGLGQQFGRVTWHCSGQSNFLSINNQNFNPKGLFTVSNTGNGSYDLNLNDNNTQRSYVFDGGLLISGIEANLVTTFLSGTSNAVLQSLTINGNLTVENGAYLYVGKGSSTPASGSYRSLVTLNGNLNISGSASKIMTGNTAYVGRILVGAGSRTFSTNADVPFDGIHIDVDNGTTLTMNSDMELRSTSSTEQDRLRILSGGILEMGTYRVFTGSGTQDRFVIESGGTVNTNNTGGLNAAIATSINTFAAGANYVFNAATTTPFHATSTLNNPGSITINADVTNNRTTGTNTLTVTGGVTINSGGVFRLISAPTLNTPANDLNLNNCALTINSGGVFDNNGENRIVSGGGTPSVIVSGTFITEDQNGFTGTNATIPSVAVTLNSGSTVDYGRNGNQDITDFAYKNVRFSGSGTKTRSGATNTIDGTVTIESGVTLNTGNNTFGSSTTNLTMNGTALYITGGSGTKPDISGTYNLSSTSTIEFSGSSATDIRINTPAINYGNIVVSGSNVSLGGSSDNSGLTLQSGAVFTVKNGATFNNRNINGLNGSSNTAIKNTNNPTVTLESGSNINYNSTTSQTITARSDYSHLTISGGGIKTLAGDIEVQGNWSRSAGATFNHNDKAVTFNGSGNSSITASGGEGFYKLYLNKNSKANQLSIIDSISIADEFKITRGLFVLNNKNVTLLSNANKTASFGQMGSTAAADINYNGTGRFVVERFINTGTATGQHGKSWQLLATPIKLEGANDQTIKEAWQEGASAANGNPKSGYGTMLTSNLSDAIAKGFDAFTRPGPSIKIWNGITQKWEGPTSAFEPVANAKGYMLFVRGDRSITTATAAPNATILRTKGKLHTPGLAPTTITMNKEGYYSVGNPYACAIDFSSLEKSSGVSNTFYVFDPTLRGSYEVGAYQTIFYDIVSNKYIATPGSVAVRGKSSTLYNSTDDFRNIQSGQAFFVYSLNYNQQTISFDETNKVTGSRLAHRPALASGDLSILSTSLLSMNVNETSMADGNRVVFSDKYSDIVDGYDAIKMTNGGENFGLIRNNKNLAVEARPMLHDADTIFYQMSGLRQMNYKLVFIPQNLSSPSLHAELIDKYLQSRSSISLTDTSFVDFVVDANPSSNASDRFMLVFKSEATAGPVPVTFTSITANRNRYGKIIVNWKTENEVNIKHYELERSANGSSFNKINIKAATANNASNAAYTHTDETPSQDVNFYRVKAIGENGQVQYSAVVKVAGIDATPTIAVYPNPVTDGKVNVSFTNKPAGNYNVQLINSIGQVIYNSIWNIPSGNNIRTIELGYGYSPGIHQLRIFSENGDSEVVNVHIAK